MLALFDTFLFFDIPTEPAPAIWTMWPINQWIVLHPGNPGPQNHLMEEGDGGNSQRLGRISCHNGWVLTAANSNQNMRSSESGEMIAPQNAYHWRYAHIWYIPILVGGFFPILVGYVTLFQFVACIPIFASQIQIKTISINLKTNLAYNAASPIRKQHLRLPVVFSTQRVLTKKKYPCLSDTLVFQINWFVIICLGETPVECNTPVVSFIFRHTKI